MLIIINWINRIFKYFCFIFAGENFLKHCPLWKKQLNLPISTTWVLTQVKTALGKADVVVFMNDATYVMELKVGGTAEEALKQIDTKDYAVPYQGTGKPVVKIGIGFSRETRTVSEWKIEK